MSYQTELLRIATSSTKHKNIYLYTGGVKPSLQDIQEPHYFIEKIRLDAKTRAEWLPVMAHLREYGVCGVTRRSHPITKITFTCRTFNVLRGGLLSEQSESLYTDSTRKYRQFFLRSSLCLSAHLRARELIANSPVRMCGQCSPLMRNCERPYLWDELFRLKLLKGESLTKIDMLIAILTHHGAFVIRKRQQQYGAWHEATIPAGPASSDPAFQGAPPAAYITTRAHYANLWRAWRAEVL